MPKKVNQPRTPRLTIEADPLKIVIEGPSEDSTFGDDLRLAAIDHLIASADTGWMEKEDAHNGTNTCGQFYLTILKTLIFKWKLEDPAGWDEDVTYGRALDMLISYAKDEGVLDEVIPQPESDPDDLDF